MVSDRNKRLLFFAYPFPPSPAIGAIRAWCIAKYLSRLGWIITVVTPDPTGQVAQGESEEAERQCLQERITRLFAGQMHKRTCVASTASRTVRLLHARRFLVRRIYHFFGMGLEDRWWRSALAACASLTPGEFDLVLATGSPFTSFLAARRIARKLAVPYVVDYRDPWSLSVHGSYWHRLWRWPLEHCLVRDAAAVLAVSPSLAQSQEEAFRMLRPPQVLSNGYDPEQISAVPQSRFPKEFPVVYAGSFYTGQREIDPVVQAIRRAEDIRPRDWPSISLHYFGDDTAHVFKSAQRYGAVDLVKCHGRVKRANVLAALHGAGCAVVIASIRDRVGQVERGIVTGKFFEILGMGVPILLVAPEDSDATAIVVGTGAGRSFQASQTESMAEWLVTCAGNGGIKRYIPPEEYSWPYLAEKLNKTLLSLLTKTDHAINQEKNRK